MFNLFHHFPSIGHHHLIDNSFFFRKYFWKKSTGKKIPKQINSGCQGRFLFLSKTVLQQQQQHLSFQQQLNNNKIDSLFSALFSLCLYLNYNDHHHLKSSLNFGHTLIHTQHTFTTEKIFFVRFFTFFNE